MNVFWIIFSFSVFFLLVWTLVFIKSVKEIFNNKPLGDFNKNKDNTHKEQYKVAVVIPMRNEEKNAAKCIESILAQTYKNIDLYIYNDRSQDNTLNILNDYSEKNQNVKVINGSKNPKGWCGKCNALYQAVNKINKDNYKWFLFLDADTVLHSDAIICVLNEAEKQDADMLSLLPKLKCDGFWDKIVQPSIGALITLYHRPDEVNDFKLKQKGFANGQFILIKSSVYFETKGHESVKNKILEDVEYAKIVKKSGYKIHLSNGTNLLETNMYSGLNEIINGWTKNLFLLLDSSITNVIKFSSLIFTISFIPFLFLLYFVLNLLNCEYNIYCTFSLLGIINYFIINGYQIVLRKFGKIYPLYGLFAPLAAILTIYILLLSTFKTLFNKEIKWKGRVV